MSQRKVWDLALDARLVAYKSFIELKEFIFSNAEDGMERLAAVLRYSETYYLIDRRPN